jgi:hypothetical protein
MGEWIERIGWPRFFKLTGIPFTKYHIDDFSTPARPSSGPRSCDTRRAAWPGHVEQEQRCPAEAMYGAGEGVPRQEEVSRRQAPVQDLTKAMIEKFGEDAPATDATRSCARGDPAKGPERSGRCVYTYDRRQLFIIDSLTTTPITLTPEELGEVWDAIEAHDKLEQEVEPRQAACATSAGSVQRSLLTYLLHDEQKHDCCSASWRSSRSTSTRYA